MIQNRKSRSKKALQKIGQKKMNILDIGKYGRSKYFTGKINKIEVGFKDNILLKRYSNHLS